MFYTAQRNFHNTWGAYHENLVMVGATPSGSYHYDVGFKDGSSLDAPTSYPRVDALNQPTCTTFQQICDGLCVAELQKTAVGKYFGAQSNTNPYGLQGSAGTNCRVTGKTPIKGCGSSCPNIGEAAENAFLLGARGRLRNEDVWTINQNREINHNIDGTQ